MHRLLRRQIEQHLGAERTPPPEMSRLLREVDAEYARADDRHGIKLDYLVDRFEQHVGPVRLVQGHGPRIVHRVGIVSGSGAKSTELLGDEDEVQGDFRSEHESNQLHRKLAQTIHF